MTLSRSLIKRCNSLFNQHVVVDDPNWRTCERLRGYKKRLLTGKVIGWSFDEAEDDEPLVSVKYDSSLPAPWGDQADNVRLSQVQLASLAACC
jgi:hypothetical protein